MTRYATEPEREWYRRLVIALWHPDVTRPIDYLRRRHRRDGWNGEVNDCGW